MNQTIDLILSHRSIRQFTAEPIAPQQLDAILAAAQSASTSSFLQVTSIVRVSEPEARQQLAMLAGNQPYVVQAASFWCSAPITTATPRSCPRPRPAMRSSC
ncbi:hypothetical protein VAWG004_17420 [Aeromonas veronii]|nr:hypothetical protein VAWG004_17420 [Aeromonas veronii]